MPIAAKHDNPPSPTTYPAPVAAASAPWSTPPWLVSQYLPSDITVKACGVSFALHKFPLVSRSGWIRKLVVESKDCDSSRIVSFNDIPGGAEAFELAAMFCYGKTVVIDATNVAMLRCAAQYLEMSEDYGERNLISRTEEYLVDISNSNLSTSVKVLHSCKDLLPMAEQLNIVSRCIDAAARRACKQQLASSLSASYANIMRNEIQSSNNTAHKNKSADCCWAEELSTLPIGFYQRVLAAMRARGLKYDSLGGAIVHYAQRALQGLIIRKPCPVVTRNFKIHDTIVMEHDQRILVQNIVSLLPPERNTASTSFLFGLLRAAIYLDTSVASRLDLERRIGLQLEQASLDDLLIPSFSYTNDTLFDVDTIHRIVENFLHQDDSDDLCNRLALCKLDHGGFLSPSSVIKVATLLDCYLAEIAPDANLTLAKFIGLAEPIPEYARVVDDGLYRAIDIYLKAHPVVNELERQSICNLMDCQKLSEEACAHAAQNERLPIQVVVQVLYFEQMRLRNALVQVSTGAGACLVCITKQEADQFSHRTMSSGAMSPSVSATEEYASMRRENMELKLEVARMKIRIADLETEQVNQKKQGAGEKGSSKSRFLVRLSRKLGKLNPFQQSSDNSKGGRASEMADLSISTRRRRRRRHSIS